ncbi:TlpA family protein disulfide reductase [Myroides sp. M-43]|uniref:TlpA family protein disulfide reductase n=1 Tax=Myroides oncorhynchi TaxID=2893756 RepID=UPI001E4D2B3E|nr:TlpA disulfide reductase family protein [Myroides oncorhynchi]MCC9043129.1 TlpA family protein disulfide reductase [Myroides oncorhynchi]
MSEKSKSKKGWLSNLIFIVILGVVLFTPVGTGIKVWLNRLLAMSPTLEKVSEQKKVNYESWQLVDEKGEIFDFDKVKGKVVVINFWATWCPPCIAEKPSFQELYNDYKNKVVFLFVTTDSPDKVKTFKEKNNSTLPIYYQKSAAPAVLFSESIPASYVIDKKGNIVVRKFRAADWNSSKFRVSLDELLK